MRSLKLLVLSCLLFVGSTVAVPSEAEACPLLRGAARLTAGIVTAPVRAAKRIRANRAARGRFVVGGYRGNAVRGNACR